MQKIVSCLLFSFLMMGFVSSNCLATSLDKIPAKESSKQWEVVVDKADSQDPTSSISDKPELYKFYSLDIKNNGNDNIELVRVEAYRDDPNTNIEFELFTIQNDLLEKNLSPAFHHSNFPLYTKATELKVVVTWIKKSDNPNDQRKYREQFVFKQ